MPSLYSELSRPCLKIFLESLGVMSDNIKDELVHPFPDGHTNTVNSDQEQVSHREDVIQEECSHHHGCS